MDIYLPEVLSDLVAIYLDCKSCETLMLVDPAFTEARFKRTLINKYESKDLIFLLSTYEEALIFRNKYYTKEFRDEHPYLNLNLNFIKYTMDQYQLEESIKYDIDLYVNTEIYNYCKDKKITDEFISDINIFFRSPGATCIRNFFGLNYGTFCNVEHPTGEIFANNLRKSWQKAIVENSLSLDTHPHDIRDLIAPIFKRDYCCKGCSNHCN